MEVHLSFQKQIEMVIASWMAEHKPWEFQVLP